MKESWVLLALSLIMWACGSSGPGTIAKTASENPKPQSTPQPCLIAWCEKTFSGKNLTARVRTLSAEERTKTQKDFSTLRQHRLESDDKLKAVTAAPIYRIEGSAKFTAEVFVAPKVFVKSGTFGERAGSEANRSDRETVRFQLAFVDGLRETVISGVSPVGLPSEYVLENKLKLQTELKALLGIDVKITALPARVERLVIESGDVRLEVRPDVERAIYPTNELFGVSVTASKEEIRKLFQESLDGKQVRIVAKLKSAVSYPTQVTNLEIDAKGLREELYKKFVEMPWGVGASDYLTYRAQDVRRGIEDILDDLAMEAGMPSLSKMHISELIDQIIADHFDADDCSEGLCLSFRSEAKSGAPLVWFDILDEESIPIAGEDITASASIADLLDGKSNFILLGENSPDYMLPEQGLRGGLLRNVREGDLVEIEISELIGAYHENEAPILNFERSRLDNPVCVKWGPEPTKEVTDYSVCLEHAQICAKSYTKCIKWDDYCKKGSRECIKRGVGLCFFCCDHVDFVCHEWGRKCADKATECDRWVNGKCTTYGTKTVPAGKPPCIETENQWVKIWEISNFPLTVKKREQAASFNQGALLSQLKIQLTHFEPGETGQFRKISTICPLSAWTPALEGAGDGVKIKFRIENTPNCAPFSNWNRREGREPELTLINLLTLTRTRQCGWWEETWNGKFTYACPQEGRVWSEAPIFATYYPRFEIRGSLKMPGTKFISTNPQIEISKKEGQIQ